MRKFIWEDPGVRCNGGYCQGVGSISPCDCTW